MERDGGAFRGRRSLLAGQGVLCLVVVALGGLVLVTSSGAETESPPPDVRTPAGSAAGAAATPSTTPSTGPATGPVDPLPGAGPTGSNDASSVPASTPETRAPAPDEFLLVCESPVVDEHGIETASSVVARVPEGTPIPAGCHRG